MNNYDNSNEGYAIGESKNIMHEIRKYKAALYIRANFDELMHDIAYKKAYDMLVDEFAGDLFYFIHQTRPTTVTDEQRNLEISILDTEISVQGKQKIEEYKEDATYIADWVKRNNFIF